MSPGDDDTAGRGTGRSRRWFLAGGAAAALGGGVGVGLGFRQPQSRPRPRPAPAALVEALAAERQLLALAAAGRRDATLRADVAVLTGDHTVHAHALQTALAAYDAEPPSPTSSTTAATPTPSRAQLRAAESAAAAAGAVRAARLSGAAATLLASISACESTHAELLT